MDYADVVGRLEVALIELEYASADFAHNRTAGSGDVDVGMLNEVAVKLAAAHRAMQTALQSLSGEIDAPQAMPMAAVAHQAA